MCKFLYGHKFWVLFGKYQEAWLLDHSKSMIRFVLQNGCSSCSSTSSREFLVVQILGFVHFNRCVVASHCCINLQFPNNIWCWTSFHHLTCHSWIFFFFWLCLQHVEVPRSGIEPEPKQWQLQILNHWNIHVSSLAWCLLRSLPCFLMGLFVFLLLRFRILYIFWTTVFYQMCLL